MVVLPLPPALPLPGPLPMLLLFTVEFERNALLMAFTVESGLLTA